MRSHSWGGPHGDELRKPFCGNENDNEGEDGVGVRHGNEIENENECARQLSVCGSAESCYFLTAPSVRGDRVVARRDGRELWVQHLVCLGAFCEAVVREFSVGLLSSSSLRRGKGRGGGGLRRSGRSDVKGEMENGMGMGMGMGVREKGVRFRGMASRGEFQKFWERWCRRKFAVTGDEVWKGMRGPYDV